MKLVKISDIWVNPEQVKAVAPQASNPENTFIYLNEEQYFVVPVHADEVARMLTEKDVYQEALDMGFSEEQVEWWRKDRQSRGLK